MSGGDDIPFSPVEHAALHRDWLEHCSSLLACCLNLYIGLSSVPVLLLTDFFFFFLYPALSPSWSSVSCVPDGITRMITNDQSITKHPMEYNYMMK